MDGFWLTDTHGKILDVNESYCKMSGFTKQELLTMQIKDIVAEESESETARRIKRIMLHGSERFNSVHRCKDGRILEVEVSVKILYSEDNHFISFFRDITEHKQAEKALQESEKRFRATFEQAAIGFAICNSRTGRYIRINQKYCDIMGYSMAEMMEKSFMDVSYSQDIQMNMDKVSQLIEGKGNEYSFEKRYIRKDGTVIWGNLTISPLWDTSSIPKEYFHIAIVEEITERKRNEEKIKSLLSEKELILKEVHHRIKNNMNTIYGLLVLQAEALNEPLAIAALHDAGNRVKSMQLLYDKLYRSAGYSDISIIEYLPPFIDEIVSNFPNKNLVGIETNIEDFILSTTKLQPLGIIINELLTNIMKYAFIGKREGLISVSAHQKDNHVMVTIADNGNGMPESISFDNSTGFGLVLVNALTQQIGGTIRIERGQGTKIVLEFEK